jgi:hypothetical protein
MTIYSRATDRMASNLLQPTFSLAAALDSATIANVQRISRDGRGDTGHGSCGNNWRLRTIYHLIDYR